MTLKGVGIYGGDIAFAGKENHEDHTERSGQSDTETDNEKSESDQDR